ncbi:MAG: DNA polymerase, partial [Planctomycetota bacterium]
MTLDGLRKNYSAVWLVDFEFQALPGERPVPLCLVARELFTGRLVRVWLEDLPAFKEREELPFDVGPDSLYVAYYASAELGCHLALNWRLPSHVLDLFVEFRNLTNGRSTVSGNGLIGALAHFGLPAIEAAEKDEMRELAIRGGPYSAAERMALLDYCQSDVDSLARLLPRMLSQIDLQRALLRGRYMVAVARMEWIGTPVDTDCLNRLSRWGEIQRQLIVATNSGFGIYEGTTFKAERWEAYLVENDVPWPRLPSGSLSLRDETFRQMARRFPEEVGPIRELRHSLGQLRLNDLSVGSEGRNRCLLSPFRSRTGRNQPSNSRFIFGPSAWLRSLIKPAPGQAVAYVDWSQQEFGIAAALSGDTAMMEAYASGDPYLTFAKQAGAVPLDATKQSHPKQRGQFKVCALAVQYGMGEFSLAQSLGEPPIVARGLLRLHRQTYPAFWHWSEAAVNHAMLFGWLQTVFGWRIHIGCDVNPRSLANFPCQANGAEMLRLACCLATERGIRVCAPVHDAVLIEAAADDIDDAVRQTQAAMREASETILSGFSLRTDADIVRWPDRYCDERGAAMWQTVCGILDQIAPETSPAAARPTI